MQRLADQVNSEVAFSWNSAMVGLQQQKLSDLWDAFQRAAISLSSSSYVTQRLIDKNDSKSMLASEIYAEIKGRLETLLRDCDPERYQPLPKVSEILLDKFDGTYKNWIAWRSVFQTKVMDTKLQPGSKIDLLLNSLDGEARNCIGVPERRDQLELDRIWASLGEVYDNPYQIVSAHINSFLELPEMRQSDSQQYQHMLNVFEQELRALKRFDYDVDSWSPFLAVLIIRKLDHSARNRWEMDRDPHQPPTLSEVTAFLKRRILAFNNASSAKDPRGSIPSRPNLKRIGSQPISGPEERRPRVYFEHGNGPKNPFTEAGTSHGKGSRASCSYCKGPHPVFRCSKFADLNLDQRRSAAGQSKLCFACLGKDHMANTCSWSCKNCNHAKHHRLLCPKSTVMRTLHIKKPKGYNHQSFSISPEQDQEDLQVIGTALFKIRQECGSSSGNIRALCDSGSQVNLITEDCVQRWNLQRKPLKVPIVGVGAESLIYSSGCADVLITDRVGKSEPLPIRFVVVTKISGHNPQRHFESPIIDQIQEDELADPTFYIPGKVDALLGVGCWSEIVQDKIIKFTREGGCFLAHLSSLGWIIAGHTNHSRLMPSLSLHTADGNHNLDAQLERFWSVDDGKTLMTLTAEEQQVEENFVITHSRDELGRYIVTIPFRQDITPLGRSRSTAFNRFIALEKRLAKPGNEHMLEAYKEFMADYVQTGHLTLAPPAPEDPSMSYYVPYHIIHKKKFRVVFDASCVTSSGISLNDLQLPGPKLQPDLAYTMLLFRTYRYALTADIVKMYRQVKVHQDQLNYQRIFYREANSEPIREYTINRVIWGFTSAGYNAVRALQQCGIDEGDRYPDAAIAIRENFFMDDLLWGADTSEELSNRHGQITELLNRGGFQLAKGASNDVSMATHLGQNVSEQVLHDEAGVLGMVWDTKADAIRIKVAESVTPSEVIPTKRQVLSQVSQVYDPTGLFLPIIVSGKILIQDIWKLNLDWDEKVPEEIRRRLCEFHHDVRQLVEVSVPRWLATDKNSSVEIHVFSDASELAYGSCAYLRATTEGHTSVRLITSRNKVAPIKRQTIPRLELMGAVMSTELAMFVIKACKFENVAVYFWTDSTIVLHWLGKETAAFKPFVAHRVEAILKESAVTQWCHVAGAENPADLVSRGCSAEQLKSSAVWWTGPSWLSLPSVLWPSATRILSQKEISADRNESKGKLMVAHVARLLPLSIESGNGSEALDMRVSSLNKLVRITAYIFRFISLCKIRRSRRGKRCRQIKSFKAVPALTPCERDAALLYWVKQSQSQTFCAEVEALRGKGELAPSSKLVQLYPYLDVEGVMRVGGRLGQSSLPDEMKHPIILDQTSTLSTLIIKDAHTQVVHGGTQLTMARIRQKFWIVRLRQATKKVIGGCITCIRFRKERAEQLMGSLPSVRTERSFPFLCSGVDFAGPFHIRQNAVPKLITRSNSKSGTHKSVKCWVVVFVCLATRAVHLDITYGLSVEAFLEAFSRFISRRGPVRELWSDNGTNFVGSNRELQRVRKEWAADWPDRQLANHGTTWRFISPGAPHQGGLWEAAVKSMKHHLRRAMGRRVLSGSQLYTIVTQIECCLNSRPIAPLSDDPSDLEILTPAHFLIGRPANFLPVADNVAGQNDNRLTLWGQQQKIQQLFWRRWQREHLVTMQRRGKWRSAQKNVEIGDMVILTAENTPPAFWSVGRIKEVHKGPDGLIRNVTLNTAAGDKVRPIQKLCLLPKA